jgi:hypothetical protein
MHAGFFWSAVSLFMITFFATRNHIVPGRLATTRTRRKYLFYESNNDRTFRDHERVEDLVIAEDDDHIVFRSARGAEISLSKRTGFIDSIRKQKENGSGPAGHGAHDTDPR